VKVVEVPPGPPVLSPIVAEIYGPEAEGRRQVAKAVRQVFARPPAWSMSTTAALPPRRARCCWSTGSKAALLGVPQQAIVSTLRAGLAGEAATYLHDGSKYPAAVVLQLPPDQPRRPERAAAADGAQRRRASWCPSASW
jgi:multidrug efflux pump subunit AcrB